MHLLVDTRKDISMIKLQADKMTKAIERAKAVRPRVRVISASERIYA